jgi:DNA topoisomerase-2
MNDEELVPMHPWWRGFKGEIKLTSKNKYEVCGVVTKLDETTVEITELPIHKWTQTFKAELEGMMVGEKGEGSVKVMIHRLRSLYWTDSCPSIELSRASC